MNSVFSEQKARWDGKAVVQNLLGGAGGHRAHAVHIIIPHQTGSGLCVHIHIDVQCSLYLNHPPTSHINAWRPYNVKFQRHPFPGHCSSCKTHRQEVPKNQPAFRAFSLILAVEFIALSRFGFKECLAFTKGNGLGYNNTDSDWNPSSSLRTRPSVSEQELTPNHSQPGRNFQLQFREQQKESFPSPAAPLADTIREIIGLEQ